MRLYPDQIANLKAEAPLADLIGERVKLGLQPARHSRPLSRRRRPYALRDFSAARRFPRFFRANADHAHFLAVRACLGRRRDNSGSEP